jgi:hypothetical protein
MKIAEKTILENIKVEINQIDYQTYQLKSIDLDSGFQIEDRRSKNLEILKERYNNYE